MRRQRRRYNMKLSELIKDVEVVDKYNYDENVEVTGVN